MDNLINDFNYIVSYVSPRLNMYLLRLSESVINNIQEIRIRAEQPVVIVTKSGCSFLTTSGKTSYIVSSNCVYAYKNEIDDTVNKMCGYSMHSHYEDLLNGYVTLPNGSRIGLAGTAVFDKDKVKGIKDITCINMRIPRNISGISEEIMSNVFKNDLEDLLIVGPPSSGKTTMLKDIVYQVSSGRLGRYYKICVVDERKEILPGRLSAKLSGPNTDVLSGYPKAQGISMAVRTLSPDIIVCDEIGQSDEIDEIINGMNTGVKFILTAHASSLDELKKRNIFKKIFTNTDFNKIVLLTGSNNPGIISEIVEFKENKNENNVNYDNMYSGCFDFCKAN